jgi:hypothetical protein
LLLLGGATVRTLLPEDVPVLLLLLKVVVDLYVRVVFEDVLLGRVYVEDGVSALFVTVP